ncbi:MAG: hypothetical protein JW795_00795 [Chitinivibrionales bacterium]|nr:hypothetical protein [Chitinivibrionales bacterium]
MKLSSIKFQLITAFASIGMVFFLFTILFVPPKTKNTAENVMKDNVIFIVKLLSDNLALGMQTIDLDGGAALQQTLNLLQGNVISSVAILNKDMQFVKGMKSNKALYAKDTMVNLKSELIVFKTMKDGDGNTQGFVEITFSKSSFISNINEFTVFIWISGIIVLIAVAVFGTSLSNKITSPLKKSIDMLKNISTGEGDLTLRLQVLSKDEVGKQSEYFNVFISKLQALVKKIAANTNGLNDISRELSGVASDASQLVDIMKRETTKTSTVMEHVVNSLKEISESTKDMASSVSSVATAIEEMSSSFNDVAKNCQNELIIAENANKKANEAGQMMQKLGDSAKKIEKIIGVIQDISDQTNLLALNATIEAASAGDAGKGFAVVANEVKLLAKQTAQATDEIKKQIGEMQQQTDVSIKSISEIIGIIESVNTISQTMVSAVEEQSVTTNNIAKNIQDVNTIVHEIATNVESNSSEIVAVYSNINDVGNAANDTQKGAQKNSENIGKLTTVISELTSIINQFKV